MCLEVKWCPSILMDQKNDEPSRSPENPNHKCLESGKHQHAQSAWKTGFKNPSLGCGASNVPSLYMFSALMTPCNHKTHVIAINSLDISHAQNSCKLSKGVSIQVSMSRQISWAADGQQSRIGYSTTRSIVLHKLNMSKCESFRNDFYKRK